MSRSTKLLFEVLRRNRRVVHRDIFLNSAAVDDDIAIVMNEEGGPVAGVDNEGIPRINGEVLRADD